MFMTVTRNKIERILVNILLKNSSVVCSVSVLFDGHCLYMIYIKKRTIFVLNNSYLLVTLIIYKHTFIVENNLAVADVA